jgi:hypothetical protein
LRVEILDENNQAITGFTLAESTQIEKDQLAAIVKWNGAKDLALLAGKTIKLRFHLNGGDLYSYWFE